MDFRLESCALDDPRFIYTYIISERDDDDDDDDEVMLNVLRCQLTY